MEVSSPKTLSSVSHEGICTPWFWPAFSLGEQTAKDGLRLADNMMAFVTEANKLDYKLSPIWATPNTIKCDLKTMILRDFSVDAIQKIPVIIDAPYAGHSATIADYATDQSLVRTLRENGLGQVYITDWKSATDSMKDFSIDTYIQDLDEAVDAVGGKAHLVGICQGGWMSAAYAARFPGKVATLLLGGAPIDTDEGDGTVKQLAHTLPMEVYRELVKAGNGRLLGKYMLAAWKSMNPTDQYIKKYIDLFTHIEDCDYLKRAEEFSRWYESPYDLPGVYYLQAVEWMFKENRLAKAKFVALGKVLSLKDITIPVYMLAGETDDITPAKQVFNAEYYLGTAPQDMMKKLVPGGHIGLFMGHDTLKYVWPEITSWILSYDAR